VSGPTPTSREPRRAAKPESLLPRELRVNEVMKILGQGVQRSEVELVLDRMAKESEKWKTIRFLDSGRLKAFAKRYGAALGNVIALMEKAPAELCMPPGLGYIVPELGIVPRLGIGTEVVDKRGNPIPVGEVFLPNDVLLRQLRVLRLYCQSWESSKLSQKQQKGAADDKRVAAWGALDLCEKHGIRPTKTKNGRICRLAAALYGHPTANFLPHCQWVLKKREASQKLADEVREARQKSLPKYARLGK
jgi:hypothetical protein